MKWAMRLDFMLMKVVVINWSMKANISRKMWEAVNGFVLEGREAMQYARFTWEI